MNIGSKRLKKRKYVTYKINRRTPVAHQERENAIHLSAENRMTSKKILPMDEIRSVLKNSLRLVFVRMPDILKETNVIMRYAAVIPYMTVVSSPVFPRTNIAVATAEVKAIDHARNHPGRLRAFINTPMGHMKVYPMLARAISLTIGIAADHLSPYQAAIK